MSLSHSTRVRGLKFHAVDAAGRHVTSHSTRVRGLKWYNLSSDNCFSDCRTLHECVDWNNPKLRTNRSKQRSHSTRVRGLKFYINYFTLYKVRVALYTSAWIEMANTQDAECYDPSRTLHECVDWNDVNEELIDILPGVALYTSAWIEIIQNK